jgi:hypothetical protein
MTTNPDIRLRLAKLRYDRAQQACPHWDMESDSSEHACCREMIDAAEELRAARAAIARERKRRDV